MTDSDESTPRPPTAEQIGEWSMQRHRMRKQVMSLQEAESLSVATDAILAERPALLACAEALRATNTLLLRLLAEDALNDSDRPEAAVQTAYNDSALAALDAVMEKQ